MPGYILHLAEAKLILEGLLEQQLVLNTFKTEEDKAQWERLFYFGALIPDAVLKERKDRSHFRNPLETGKIVVAPHLRRFLEIYHPTWKQPVLCGYYAHLHLDYCFFTSYLNECVEFQDDKGFCTDKIEKCKMVLIKKNKVVVPVEDFFSEEWFYGDYTKLNHYIKDKYFVAIPNRVDGIFIPVEEARGANLNEVINRLNDFLYNTPVEDVILKVFADNTIESFLQQTAQKFVEEMKRDVI